MQPTTLYISKVKNGNEIKLADQSRYALKKTFDDMGEGMYKVFIQEVKRVGGWKYRFHFGHVLPMIVEYMNRNEINQLIDPTTGELTPIDVDTLHEYHKQIFNPALIKNVLKKKDTRGNVPEFIVVPMTTTKMSDGDFINRYEEEIISTYSNQYGIEFLSREEFRLHFEEGKNSKQIIEMQMEIL